MNQQQMIPVAPATGPGVSAPGPSTTETPDLKPDLAAVSLSSKIPDFWTDQPRVWFIRTEAILAPQKMGDEVKFNIIVSKLCKESIQQVTDMLINPPDNNKFDALKNRLLAVYEESENRQIQKLIGEMDLGEQKPSQLLRRMRDLARGKIPDETLRILWQGHLPPAARAVLAVTDIKELESLANIADKVLETTRPAHVNEVAQISSNKILDEIAKLGRRLEALERGRQRQGRSDRSQSRGRSQSRRSPRDKFCFYHARFRDKANKCVKPCAWKVPAEQEN